MRSIAGWAVAMSAGILGCVSPEPPPSYPLPPVPGPAFRPSTGNTMVIPNGIAQAQGPRVMDPQAQMNIAARDAAVAEACDRLKGHFVPIPDAPAQGSTLT